MAKKKVASKENQQEVREVANAPVEQAEVQDERAREQADAISATQGPAPDVVRTPSGQNSTRLDALTQSDANKDARIAELESRLIRLEEQLQTRQGIDQALANEAAAEAAREEVRQQEIARREEEAERAAQERYAQMSTPEQDASIQAEERAARARAQEVSTAGSTDESAATEDEVRQ